MRRKLLWAKNNNQESKFDRYIKKNSHISVHKYGVKTLQKNDEFLHLKCFNI